MLRTTFERVLESGPIEVVTLESFLVHARNLIEFFFDGAGKRAVLPKDFGGPRGWDKDPSMAALRNKISQLVSHLTWDRVTIHELQSQDWSYPRLKDIYDRLRSKAQETFSEI